MGWKVDQRVADSGGGAPATFRDNFDLIRLHCFDGSLFDTCEEKEAITEILHKRCIKCFFLFLNSVLKTLYDLFSKL